MPEHSPTSFKDTLLKDSWIIILVSALTIALGILLSEVQAKIGWRVLTAALLTLVAIFAVVLWIMARYVFAATRGSSEDIRRVLERYLGSGPLSWVVTTPQLVEIEASKEVPEVWCISADLAEDSVGGPFQSVVSRRLQAGVRYRYFVPDRPEIRARAEQLRMVNRNSANLSFTYISGDFFFLVGRFDLAIYDPLSETQNRDAYLGIPVFNEERHYHARVGGDFVDAMIGRLLGMGSSASRA